jgi:hypothetical protein
MKTTIQRAIRLLKKAETYLSTGVSAPLLANEIKSFLLKMPESSIDTVSDGMKDQDKAKADEIWDECYPKCSTLRETWRMAMESYHLFREKELIKKISDFNVELLGIINYLDEKSITYGVGQLEALQGDIQILLEQVLSSQYREKEKEERKGAEEIDLIQYVTNLLYAARIEMAKPNFDKWVEEQTENLGHYFASLPVKQSVTEKDIEKEALTLAKKHAKQSVGDFAVGFNWGAKLYRTIPCDKEVREILHIILSKIDIDKDNLDYIKANEEICGKLRWDLVERISNYIKNMKDE